MKDKNPTWHIISFMLAILFGLVSCDILPILYGIYY